MACLRRLPGLLLLLLAVYWLLVGQPGGTSSAQAQLKELLQRDSPLILPGAEPVTSELPKGDAFTLPLDRSARQKLEGAEDYLKEQSWKEVSRLVQAVLDVKEDSFYLLPAEPAKRLPERWTSTRAEAERLLASLPPAGREFYQVVYEPQAQRLLKDAKASQDPQQFTEIVRRFLYTNSGAEAVELLGTYYLDRGQPDLAALAFQRRLERSGHEPALTPLTLFKALLTFRATGDKAREQDVWNMLEKQIARTGLRLGTRVYTAVELREQLPHWNSLPSLAGDSPLYRGNPARTGRGTGEAPYLEARRRLPLTELPEARVWLQQAADAVPPNAVPLPGSSPLAFGDKLIYRSQSGLQAFDVRTGKELWRTPSALSLDAGLLDAGKKVQLAQWLGMYRGARNVLLENTLTGTLSSDGKRIYAIEDLLIPPHPDLISQLQNGGIRYFGPFTDMAQPAKMHNKLRAVNAETGEVEWEIGGSEPKTPPELLGALFLGPPLPLGNSLFAIVEQKQELRLLCLHADRGAVQWAQSLGVPRDRIVYDLLRRTQALQLAYADGVLVCPTGSGAVLGLDPLSHTLLWAHNYRDRQAGIPDPNLPVIEYNPESLHNCWKQCAPIVQDGRVVFTAPDGDAVRCLDLRSGALLWKVSRTEEDLYLGAVAQGKVLLVGKNSCRALNLGNGGPLWQQLTGRPSGVGTLAGSTYYLPLKANAILALDLENPRETTRLEGRGETAVGNLLFHGGELWSQTATELTAFPPLSTQRERVEALVREHDTAANRLERGALRLARGEWTGAIADLRKARELEPDNERARQRLMEALTQWLTRDFNMGEKHLAEYRALTTVEIKGGLTPEEQQRLQREQLQQHLLYYSLVAQGREQQGRLLDAVQAYADFFDHVPAGESCALLDDPSVRVRADVWTRLQIGALVQRAQPEAAAAFQAHLEREADSLATHADSPALTRFATLFGAIPGPLGAPGRAVRLQRAELAAASPNRRQALNTELELLALQHAADAPAFAARVLQARITLLTRQGLLDDAVALSRRLAKDYPLLKLPDGRTTPEALDQLASDKRFFVSLQETRPSWQGRKMKAKELPKAGMMMPLMAMTRDTLGDVPPSSQRWRFLLNAQTWQVHVLDRDTMLESWSVPIPPFDTRRIGFDGDMFRARVMNHLAILNVGTNLVAIDLIERRVRWTYDLFDENMPRNSGFVFNPDGSFHVYSNEGLILYKLGLVGPVTASSITVQTRFGLKSLDPADGRVRWQRTDTSIGLDVFGDEEHLYLVEYHNDNTVRDVRAVRAADGAAAAIPDAADLYAKKLRTSGRCLLISELGVKDEVNLSFYDVHLGKEIWRKQFPKETILLDSTTPTLAAAATPRGEVSVFELQTGQEIKKLAIKPSHMDKVTKGTFLVDAANYYVALVGPNDPQGRFIDAGQLNYVGDLRFAPINGMFYAFDRQSGEVKNASRVLNQLLLLNRFEELPVVVFSSYTVRETGPQGSGQQAGYLSTLSIDKHTGKRLLNRELQNNNGEQFHTLYVDPRGGFVDLISNSSRIRHQVAPK